MVDVMPYAQALFEIANESNDDEQVGKELKDLADLWSKNQDLIQFLKHPKVKREEKEKLLESILQDSKDATVSRFIRVCNQHDVVAYMPEIYQGYLKVFNKAHAIEVVEVESATDLDAKQCGNLKEVLAKKLNKTIQLNVKVDPSLIAGLRVRTNEFVLDNTILSKANSMKEKIKNN